MERVEMPAQLQPAKARKPRAKPQVIPAVERAIKAARVARQVIALLERNGCSWNEVADVTRQHFDEKQLAQSLKQCSEMAYGQQNAAPRSAEAFPNTLAR